jgi:hypothetical protein
MGAELKPAYYHQAAKNVQAALLERAKEQAPLFADDIASDESEVELFA